ncbi:hypothetical protein [Mesonia maritima]|uniref:Uncharacterized protein n=1 Tax=Mesonia maritima TaxID=1793873 RepID=A0ABU1K9J8_9FLAO|nr:hypothetical protein [Mesonia maritima]MDR6302287.1 hypothetical protein [Mesonia maritima]
MQLTAIANNLKKYLTFTQKRVKSGAGMLGLSLEIMTTLKKAIKSMLIYLKFEGV